MRIGHERAHGPYRHGNRWRVVLVGANGARDVRSFETEAEATEVVEAARRISDSRTVGQAVTAYLETRGDKEQQTARYRLEAMLRLTEADRQLATLTPAVARKLYEARLRDEVAGATLHSELGYVNRWGCWCASNGWLQANPFAAIKPVGPDGKPLKVNRGKPKLRVNASRQFLAYLANDSSMEATAVLTAFVLGLRANEVVKRVVADLDDDGRLLWIRDTKTAAGDREIEIPEMLRGRLLALTATKHPTEPIFGAMTRHALHYHTVRLCRAAGVPRVTPHGLRGSGATNAVRLGGTVADVARAIGHADEGRTLRRHYLGGGAEESARGRHIEALLARDTASPADGLLTPVGADTDVN